MDFSSSHADATHFYLKRHCYFFTEFGVAFLSAGATSHRICQAIDRMKTVYGIEVECSVFPSRILITVWDAEENRSYSSVGHPRTLGVNLRISDELDRLSRNVVSEGIEVACAEKMLREIISTRRLASWKVTPLVGLANASFCRLFGGDPVSMLIVFAATVEGFALKTWLVSHRFDARISTFLSAFLAALFATSGYVFGWGEHRIWLWARVCCSWFPGFLT